jgi:hypothetical protein
MRNTQIYNNTEILLLKTGKYPNLKMPITISKTSDRAQFYSLGTEIAAIKRNHDYRKTYQISANNIKF